VRRQLPVSFSVSEEQTGNPSTKGRLWKVTEPSGSAGANVTTTYGYDARDRLRSVSTTATVSGSSVTQARSFVFDGLGFLRSGTHPEKGATGNGTVTYANWRSSSQCHWWSHNQGGCLRVETRLDIKGQSRCSF
jgi:YD repeat-containing protein